jgi:hypothetical protein
MYLKWSQTVRDKEFLVEMRLRNLEPEETKGKMVEKRGGAGAKRGSGSRSSSVGSDREPERWGVG